MKERSRPEIVQFTSNCRRYGLSVQDWINLFVWQGGVCAICGQPENFRKVLSIDHDHETDKIRGLLCSHCNLGLGQFQDNRKLLNKAEQYLEKHESFAS